MHLTHVRKSDLNLLPALAVLLEERSISRAAARHHLSQPAMSRVLQRLRETFGDELLVRTANGYELTTRARR
jgi:DNA-binding transcriptional LysR family regulator